MEGEKEPQYNIGGNIDEGRKASYSASSTWYFIEGVETGHLNAIIALQLATQAYQEMFGCYDIELQQVRNLKFRKAVNPEHFTIELNAKEGYDYKAAINIEDNITGTLTWREEQKKPTEKSREEDNEAAINIEDNITGTLTRREEQKKPTGKKWKYEESFLTDIIARSYIEKARILQHTWPIQDGENINGMRGSFSYGNENYMSLESSLLAFNQIGYALLYQRLKGNVTASKLLHDVYIADIKTLEMLSQIPGKSFQGEITINKERTTNTIWTFEFGVNFHQGGLIGDVVIYYKNT